MNYIHYLFQTECEITKVSIFAVNHNNNSNNGNNLY